MGAHGSPFLPDMDVPLGTLDDRDPAAAASALASLTAAVASRIDRLDDGFERQVVDAVAATLVRHSSSSSSVDVVSLAFALLSTLSRSGVFARHAECLSTAACAVVQCIGQRGCRCDVMSSGLWLLEALATGSGSAAADALVPLCVDVVMGCIGRADGNDDTIREGMQFLASVAVTAGSHVQLVRCVPVVAECLCRADATVGVTLAGLRFLACVAVCPDNAVALMQYADVVLRCMSGPLAASSEVAELGLRFLTYVSADDANKAALLSCMDVVLQCMAGADAGSETVPVALWFLGSLSTDAGNSTPLLRCVDVVLARLGGGDGVAAMEPALWLLRNLSANPDHRVPLLRCVDGVLTCLSGGCASGDAVQQGLAFLCNLAANEDSAASLLCCVPAVAECTAAAGASDEVMQWGTLFLAKMSAWGEDPAALLQCVDSVLSCMLRERVCDGVVQRCMLFLANMSVCDDDAAALLRCVDGVLSCMLPDGASSAVVEHGLRFLANLSASAEDTVPLVRCVDGVVSCVAREDASTGVMKHGLQFLANLSASAENRGVLLRCVDSVVECLGRSGVSCTVAAYAVSLLADLAGSVENRLALARAPGCVDTVVACVQRAVHCSGSDGSVSRDKGTAAEVDVDVCGDVVHDDVMQAGLRFLANVSDESAARTAMPLQRVVDVTLACLADSDAGASAAVMVQGLRTLTNCVTADADDAALARCMDCVMTCMTRDDDGSGDVAELGIRFVEEMLNRDVDVPQLPRCVDVVAACITRAGADSHHVVVEQGFQLLTHVSFTAPMAGQQSVHVPLAIATLTRYGDSEDADIAEAVFLFLLEAVRVVPATDRSCFYDALPFARTWTCRRGVSDVCHTAAGLFIGSVCFDVPGESVLHNMEPEFGIDVSSMVRVQWASMPEVYEDAVAWLRRRQAGDSTGVPPSLSRQAVGDGSCGCVWRIERRGVPFAVKVFDGTVFEPVALRHVLGHPNVVYVVGYCSEPAGVVTELVTLDGAPCTLAQWLRSRAGHECALDVKLDVLQQVCRGMAFVHDQGLVHCDLKPSNVLMARYGDGSLCAKVGDFGLAIEVFRGPAQRLGGTPAYACPCDDVAATGKAFDVWSFGLMVGEVLLGDRLVFDGGALSGWRVDDGVQRQLSCEVQAIGGDSGVGSPELWRLVDRCLRCDCDARPSFDEVACVLGECQGQCGVVGDDAGSATDDTVTRTVPVERVVVDSCVIGGRSSSSGTSRRLISPLRSVRSRLSAFTPPVGLDHTQTVAAAANGAVLTGRFTDASSRSTGERSTSDGAALASGWFAGTGTVVANETVSGWWRGDGADVSKLA